MQVVIPFTCDPRASIIASLNLSNLISVWQAESWDKGSPCDGVGSWQVGDQILEVNGRSFLSILHDEAVKLLKSSRHLILTVKDVGRLPHARTTVDQTKWIASSRIGESTTSSAGSGSGTGCRDPWVTSENQNPLSSAWCPNPDIHCPRGHEHGLFPSLS